MTENTIKTYEAFIKEQKEKKLSYTIEMPK